MLRLFQDGEKVLHTSKRKVGTVLSFIGGEERRYYVKHSGAIWSVPEKYLDSASKKSS